MISSRKYLTPRSFYIISVNSYQNYLKYALLLFENCMFWCNCNFTLTATSQKNQDKLQLILQVTFFGTSRMCKGCANLLILRFLTLLKMALYCPPLLLGHWYEIMALYYVKSILTEISASRQDRRVLQKSKIIKIEFLSKWGMLQTSRYV